MHKEIQYYMVGGCVRDSLMGFDPRDIDYVVVGATEEDMLAANMKKVGADFPVFLHAVDGNEYALARVERKTGDGYNGFVTETDGVTLEQDLGRRDLTINAMAQDPTTGKIIDPFNGRSDLIKGIIRHVNPDAFKEDPVRVLRVARFLARWTTFTVADETFKLIEEMVKAGDMDHLTPERVWKETEKALSEPMPSRFFTFLHMVGALKVVMPEIADLHGIPQPFKWHPEGCAFVHTMMVLDEASYSSDDPLTRFCALTHDLGKATSDPAGFPSHKGHEFRGIKIIKDMCERLTIPNEYRDHAMLVSEYHTHIHNLNILNSKTIVKMFDALNYRKNQHIVKILPCVSECDHRGRTSFFSHRNYPNRGDAMFIFSHLMSFRMRNHKTPEELKGMSVEAIKNFEYRTKINMVDEARKMMVVVE